MRRENMNTAALVDMVQTWFDAQTLAEMLENPFLRMNIDWDLHGWEAEEMPAALKFRHVAEDGRTTVSILVFHPEYADEFAPAHLLVVDGDVSVCSDEAAQTHQTA
jgi:hypothetical protein